MVSRKVIFVWIALWIIAVAAVFSWALIVWIRSPSQLHESSIESELERSERDRLPNDPGIRGVIHIPNDDLHVQEEKKDSSGHVITPRIVGGSTVPKGDYPFFTRVDHNNRPWCGGTLVAPDVVLTAGHCEPPPTKTISVIVNGYHDKWTRFEDQRPRYVNETIKHPEYEFTSRAYLNDLMLLKLSEPVEDVPYVTLNRENGQPKIGEEVTVMGLGKLTEGGSYPDTLQEVDLHVIDRDTCHNSYKSVGLGPIVEDTMVYAGTVTDVSRDSCTGDSGGPVLNGLGVQVGVISFGYGCARDGFPSVNMRTATLGKDDWLGETLCRLTQSSALDEWCGKSSVVSSETMPQAPIFINAGTSQDYVDSKGNTWIADKGFVVNGRRYSTSRAISNTDDPKLYQTERYGALTYKIPLLNGAYNVSLHFAEIFKGAQAVGARVFDVSMGTKLVEYNLDVYAEAGEGDKALVKSALTTVDDETLTIRFKGVKQKPKVSAVEIHQVASTVVTPAGEPKQEAIFIDAGAISRHRDQNGNVWMPDKGYFTAGKRSSTREPITDTDIPKIYQTERYRAVLNYTIPLENGYYDLWLHFAEIYRGAFEAGKREFNVFVQGELIVEKLDIFKEAGNEGYKAYIVKRTDVEVTDGSLTILLKRVRQMAKISAIQILPVGIPSR